MLSFTLLSQLDWTLRVLVTLRRQADRSPVQVIFRLALDNLSIGAPTEEDDEKFLKRRKLVGQDLDAFESAQRV